MSAQSSTASAAKTKAASRTSSKSASAQSSKSATSNKPTASAKTHAASHSTTATHTSATHAKSGASTRGSKSKLAKSRANGKTRNSKTTSGKAKNGKTKTVARGQQKIAPERAQEIEEALVREHYLSEAAGTWNEASEGAMRRYQSDHGWQSKTVPDARALIALGLGPSHDRLLNPESAMTTEPESPRAALAPSSQSPASRAPMNTNANPAAPTTSIPQDSGSPQ
jgi:hypothetical protein